MNFCALLFFRFLSRLIDFHYLHFSGINVSFVHLHTRRSATSCAPMTCAHADRYENKGKRRREKHPAVQSMSRRDKSGISDYA